MTAKKSAVSGKKKTRVTAKTKPSRSRPVTKKKATSAKTAKRKLPKAAKSSAARKPARPAGRSKRKSAPVKAAQPARTTRPGTGSSKSSKKEEGRIATVDKRHLRASLLDLRERVVKEIEFLAGDNLNRSMRDTSGDLSSYSLHMADQGTDNFDRDFALNLVSSEQDTLYEIDAALQRLDEGRYGKCEMCGHAIEKERLEALPFATMCISCKAESEKGKTHFRAFGEIFKG